MILENKKSGENKVDKKKELRNGWVNHQQKRILLIVASIGVILAIILFSFIRNNNRNYNNIKEDKSKYIIYEINGITKDAKTRAIPYINIKSEGVRAVNEDIKTFASAFSTKDKFTYEYQINGMILSLILKGEDSEAEYALPPYFRTYNINLNSLNVISDEALLEFYHVSESDVEAKIESNFKKFYSEVSEEYMDPKECNYSCFLLYRGIENYLDEVSYFVKSGNLIALKPFVFSSIYGEEEYFKESDYEFLVAEAKEALQ